MLKRLVRGAASGVVAGALVAVAVRASGLAWSAAVAVLAAVVAGALSGLAAGKPVWAHGARVEAGLKAAVGAVVVGIAMVGVRRFLGGVTVHLGPVGDGPLPASPFVVLPLLGAAFALVVEIDDAFGSEGSAPLRVVPDASPEAPLEEGDDAEADARARRRS